MDTLRRGCWFAAVVVLVAAAPARAQATAQLAGTIRDESGAVLPGVSVGMIQIDLGFTRSVVTEANGELNHFNWGDPTVNFDAANFGRIQAQAGIPRVLQFGIKYGF